MTGFCLFQRIAIDFYLVRPNRENSFGGKRELTYACECGQCTAKLAAIHSDYICIFWGHDFFFNPAFNSAVLATNQFFPFLFDSASPPQKYLFMWETHCFFELGQPVRRHSLRFWTNNLDPDLASIVNHLKVWAATM